MGTVRMCPRRAESPPLSSLTRNFGKLRRLSDEHAMGVDVARAVGLGHDVGRRAGVGPRRRRSSDGGRHAAMVLVPDTAYPAGAMYPYGIQQAAYAASPTPAGDGPQPQMPAQLPM